MTCLPSWLSHSPDICHIKTSPVSNILHFPERQLYSQYVVESAFVLDILNVYPIMLDQRLYCQFVFFFTCLCFYILNSPDMYLSWQHATNLPLFQRSSFHLACVYHVNNSLIMSPLTFYFHLTCTSHVDCSLNPSPY